MNTEGRDQRPAPTTSKRASSYATVEAYAKTLEHFVRSFGEVPGNLASHETSALLGIGYLWQLRADEKDPKFEEKEQIYWSVARRNAVPPPHRRGEAAMAARARAPTTM